MPMLLQTVPLTVAQKSRLLSEFLARVICPGLSICPVAAKRSPWYSEHLNCPEMAVFLPPVENFETQHKDAFALGSIKSFTLFIQCCNQSQLPSLWFETVESRSHHH